MLACEEIYRPTLDEVDDLLVVEAILISNQTANTIHLYYTQGFNDNNYNYPPASGATVYLVDDQGNSFVCRESSEGYYNLNQMLDSEREYILKIELNGDTFISEMQAIPKTPSIDTIYGEYDYNVSIHGTASSTDKLQKEYGFQLYADMKYREGLNHYRFYAKKIIQYYDYYDTVIGTPPPVTLPIYIWRSIYPGGTFNIAGPPEYSTSKDISKHELEFFPQDYNKYFPDTMSFAGWIYIIHQYGINKDTYDFYKKMNQQLDADGKIFDPIYIQLEGNIRCENNPDKKVLGNFEISSYAESRCYLTYNKAKEELQIKRILYQYDIPSSGYIKFTGDNAPDFWESMNKRYPNE